VSGAVRGLEVKVYDLAQAGEALRVSEGRHFRGKLVLKVR
jgi:NADPH:quinone reductase-like Zn-dependent oxidoreductase